MEFIFDTESKKNSIGRIFLFEISVNFFLGLSIENIMGENFEPILLDRIQEIYNDFAIFLPQHPGCPPGADRNGVWPNRETVIRQSEIRIRSELLPDRESKENFLNLLRTRCNCMFPNPGRWSIEESAPGPPPVVSGSFEYEFIQYEVRFYPVSEHEQKVYDTLYGLTEGDQY